METRDDAEGEGALVAIELLLTLTVTSADCNVALGRNKEHGLAGSITGSEANNLYFIYSVAVFAQLACQHGEVQQSLVGVAVVENVFGQEALLGHFHDHVNRASRAANAAQQEAACELDGARRDELHLNDALGLCTRC